MAWKKHRKRIYKKNNTLKEGNNMETLNWGKNIYCGNRIEYCPACLVRLAYFHIEKTINIYNQYLNFGFFRCLHCGTFYLMPSTQCWTSFYEENNREEHCLVDDYIRFQNWHKEITGEISNIDFETWRKERLS